MAEENMFEQAPENPVDQLVGEGKKYKDVNELAKAYLHADNHIKTTVADNSSLKDEIQSVKDILEAQLEQRNQQQRQQEPTGQREEGTPPAKAPKEEVDLKAEIREALKTVSEEDRAKKNSRLTSDVMIEKFGTKEAAQAALVQKAEELEVSPQFIADMAFRSPTAFFATMGIDPKATSKSTPNSSSDVNPQALKLANPGIKPNTYEWYQQIRKSDRSKFFSTDVQKAFMNDALNNPDFYKKT